MGQLLSNEDEEKEKNEMINNEYNLLSVSPSEYANSKWTEDISWQSFSKTLEEIINKTVCLLQNKNGKTKIYYLDIGSGPGNITNLISEYFDYFITIEPNPLYYNNYNFNTNKYLGNINKFIQNINFDADFKNIKFDLITCIHTFYYVEINDYKNILNKLYKLLNNNGGKLIISMAPKYKDITSNWSQIMYEFIGYYFDSLHLILSICSKFDGVDIKIFDEETCFDNTYSSMNNAIDNILWNIMEELSFSRKCNKSIQNKDIAMKILKCYLKQNCVNNINAKCTVTASVGHIVITKSINIKKAETRAETINI